MGIPALQIETELPDWVYDSLEDKTDFRDFLVTKGLGAGGTYGACIWHYAMCQINYRSRLSWAVAPTYAHIADPIIPTFAEVLAKEYRLEEGSDYSIVTSGQPRIELHKTKQLIAFKSANRPDRLVGANVSHATGTEPGLWPKLAFQKLTDRIRCPNATRRQKMLEGTPEGLGNAWEEIANFDPGVDEERNAVRIILETRDNPVLAAQYIRKLEQTYAYDSAKLESYLRGRFIAFTKGTAYWEFRESRNVTLDVKASPFLPILFAWDFGRSPLAWVGLQRQPHERRGYRYHRFVALAEGSGNARGIHDACAEFIVAFPPEQFRDTPIEIDGGHDGYFGSHLAPNCAYDQILQILKRYYSNVRVVASKAAPTIEARLNRVAALCLYEQFVVAAWCRNLIKSLTQSNLKPGTWELEKKKGEDMTHFGDAVCCPLFRLTRDEDLANPNAQKILGLNRPL